MLRLGARDRLNFQCALVAVAEGAQLSTSRPTAAPYVCVAALLSDARMCALGGREGLPRSLGSVYAGAVSRFLRGRFTGSLSHRTPLPEHASVFNVFGVSRDGTRLFVGLNPNMNFAQLYVLETAGGAIIKHVTTCFPPLELAVAPDGVVYVITYRGSTFRGSIIVLDPSLVVCSSIDHSGTVYSVCASVECVAFVCYASDGESAVVIMRRHDHAIFRRISIAKHINACCFTAAGTQVAIAHTFDISIFNVADGARVSQWSIPPPQMPYNFLSHRIKSTDFNELVVYQSHENRRNLIVYDATGQVVKTVTADRFNNGIAVFGGAVITSCFDGSDSWFDVYE